jgi:hypothetical protein
MALLPILTHINSESGPQGKLEKSPKFVKVFEFAE